MTIITPLKPSSTIATATAPGEGITWDANLNTWAAETRTWDDTKIVINNQTKPSSSITTQAKPA